MIQIVLNGDTHDLPAPMSVDALLTRLGIDRRMVAVELDRAVVKRERYGETTVEDGAEVEIVAFVGGGDKVQSSKFEVRSSKLFRLCRWTLC